MVLSHLMHNISSKLGHPYTLVLSPKLTSLKYRLKKNITNMLTLSYLKQLFLCHPLFPPKKHVTTIILY